MINYINKNIEIILFQCAVLKEHEKVLIITDNKTNDVANLFKTFLMTRGFEPNFIIIDAGKMHGSAKINEKLEETMLYSDVILGLTSYSLAHTDARKKATDNGSRYLSLPDFSFELLKKDIFDINYALIDKQVNHMANLLTTATKVKITTKKGTNLELDLHSRKGSGYSCLLNTKGAMGSPPDIEANIAPNEYMTNGVLIVDGSIPHPELGICKEAIRLTIEHGKITHIEGYKNKILEKIFHEVDENAKIAAELGFGFNPKANLSGIMLEDEGKYGTFHIGFGSNSTIGGANKVAFHLDMIINDPTVYLDEKLVIDNGEFLYEE